MATLALVAFLVVAAIDWLAVAQERREIEYVAKPAALGMLLIFVGTGWLASGWLIAALVFSLLGDVYLMLPGNLFAAGLAAFLLGHISYIGAFDVMTIPRVIWFVITFTACFPFARRILRAVDDPALRTAVGAYIGVIALMVGSAFASGDPRAIVGALLFLTSDGILAWNRFVQPLSWARLAIVVTYHLGQLGLAAALRVG